MNETLSRNKRRFLFPDRFHGIKTCFQVSCRHQVSFLHFATDIVKVVVDKASFLLLAVLLQYNTLVPIEEEMTTNGDKADQDKKDDENPSINKLHLDETKLMLENSAIFPWLKGTLDFFQTPSNVLLISSIPFCLGAYYGFIQPGENLEKWVGDVPTADTHGNGGDSSNHRNVARNGLARRAMQKEVENLAARQLGFQMASKALGIATFANLGAFSILGAVGFYLSGCKSINEAMTRTQQWASTRAQAFDEWIGLDNRESKTHPEVLATKNMTEEEELNYVYDRLMKEIQPEDSGER